MISKTIGFRGTQQFQTHPIIDSENLAVDFQEWFTASPCSCHVWCWWICPGTDPHVSPCHFAVKVWPTLPSGYVKIAIENGHL